MSSIITIPSITIQHKTFSLTIPEISVEPGEILGMFGKSGAGKTSYLKRVREHFGPEHVHYMSQYDGLFEDITIEQNIELGLALSEGKEISSDWKLTHKTLLHDFEVDQHFKKYPRMMSGGQRKRSEIVRALLMQPDILLLDEPFLGIGHLFEAVCTREILRRSEEQQGVSIIVSHDFNVLSSFSKRILLIDDQGIIGFIPTKDPLWLPTLLREAWTIGMENVWSSDDLQFMQCNAEITDGTHAIGAFLTDSEWQNTTLSQSITVPAAHILTERSCLHSGTLVTHLTVSLGDDHPPVSLVGRGTIDRKKPITLGLKRVATLTA